MKLDKWQQEVLDTKGNICLCSGRQVGKSTAISIKAGEFIAKNPRKSVLVIASVERQAYLLFEKVLSHLYDNYRQMIKKGKDKPTKHQIKLTNGSIIRCLPAGLTGYGIRGFTIDQLYADEAAFIPEEVWTAVTPMLAITKGKIILLSTPHGTENYFHRCFSDDSFSKFHVSAEDCPRKDVDFLEREKKRMTSLQYAQEYLGEFIADLRQVFPDELIKKCMVLKRRAEISKNRKYYLGVDVAGMGEDESSFEIIDRMNNSKLEQVENQVTKKTRTTETTSHIIGLNRQYNFTKEYIDSGGLGVGVCDQLRLDENNKRKVVEINNATRIFDRDSTGKEIIERTKRLMKEHLYNNLRNLMERGEIQLLDDPEIFQSLKSVQFEITEDRIKYFGNYTHIAEGIIRAAWCVKDKTLNIGAFCK